MMQRKPASAQEAKDDPMRSAPERSSTTVSIPLASSTPSKETAMTTHPAPRSTSPTIDQWVFRIAGTMVLVSLILSQLHSVYWMGLTAFVGANLLQSSYTGFCPLAVLLRRLGVKPGAAFYPPGQAG
jgi:hypothetical protein